MDRNREHFEPDEFTGPREPVDSRAVRDAPGLVPDLEGDTAPRRKVWVDLGCGMTKLPEFIGVDRFPLPGVDVVADLDAPLPFADDCVDLVYASHSLEHIRDLTKTIREVSRICKHGAQICIVAPYYQQGLNLANPYHKQVFNEHTPRFWTTSPVTSVDPEEYHHPHASGWGLLGSDHSEDDLDIRCIKMVFLYFPEYRDMPAHLQRFHRRHSLDVCDQVVYHLIVLKKPTTPEAFGMMVNHVETFQSPYISIRRLQEQCERLEASLREANEHQRELAAAFHEANRDKGELLAAFREANRGKEELLAAFREANRDKEELAGEASRLESTLVEHQIVVDGLASENRTLHQMIERLEESGRAQVRPFAITKAGVSRRALQVIRRTRAAMTLPPLRGSRHGRPSER
jgi:SAM-dependent methyltransferase